MNKVQVIDYSSRTRVMKMWCPCCDRKGSRRLPQGHYLRWCLDLPIARLEDDIRRAMVCTVCLQSVMNSGDIWARALDYSGASDTLAPAFARLLSQV
jgi:hypothetical protein